MPLLETRELTKHYGPAIALDALTLQVKPGEIVGLLGPNGAGKSTALRMILGFLRPTSGTATVQGRDCWHQSVETRRLISYLPGELRLYDTMTGRQLIRFLTRLRPGTPLNNLDRLIQKFDIDIDRPLTRMSSGMKRKVALVTVLLPQVPLLILDEPTNTLDPNMRDALLEELQQARHRGQAVLFSSHVLQEVEAVCDRVVILRRGRLVLEQLMEELRAGRHVTAELLGPLSGPPPAGVELSANGRLDLHYIGPMPPLLHWLARQPIANLKMEPLGLSPIYRKIHGNQE